MSKTFSFSLLDFHLVRPYTKSTGIILVLGIAMGIFNESPSILSSYLMASLMIMLSYPFAVGEKNALDTLYGTLSLRKIDVVRGRYLFAIALQAFFFVFSFFSSWALSLVLSMSFDASQMMVILSVSSFVFSFVVSIQYPLYFKMGYTKARIFAFIPFFVIFLLALQLPLLTDVLNMNVSLESMFLYLENHILVLSMVPVAVGLILMYLSSLLSYSFYSKRDL